MIEPEAVKGEPERAAVGDVAVAKEGVPLAVDSGRVGVAKLVVRGARTEAGMGSGVELSVVAGNAAVACSGSASITG